MNIKGTMLVALTLAMAGCAENKVVDMTPSTKYVEEYSLSGATCGYGKKVTARRTVDGNRLTMGGKAYDHGFGTHPESALGFALDGKAEAFDALVGIDDDGKKASKGAYGIAGVEFRIWADGRVVWSSGEVKAGMDPVKAHVDLRGVRELVLETTAEAPWRDFPAANADWAEARFTARADAKILPFDDPALTKQLGILTPKEKPEPQFNGADIWGVRPGHPVIFRVPVSGARPMKFTARNLPTGVTLDPAKGILGGVAPQKKGDYDITITAENSRGKAERVIRLAVGDKIALTPPMGWNSWNTLCYRLTDKSARAAALAMELSGLGDHGWSYINLDDWWEMNNSGAERIKMREQDLGSEDVTGPARDAQGRINCNRSFPDMKALTDYIHGFGFKAGLYSSPGPLTCGKCEGSYGHELQDATSWAEWGFDYVKYDWCHYSKIFKQETGWEFWEWEKRDPTKPITRPVPPREAFVKPYRLMNECLRKQNRDILFSYCQYGTGESHMWARENGANCWRSWDDLKDGWKWMEMALEGRIGAENFHRYNGPGCWADPDMMIIGQQYSFGHSHQTFLTPNEQYTHVSLWCMVGSPLLIGCDLPSMDDFTRSLLANDAVIAVSQDRLGQTARRIRHVDTESVWVRPLADGAKAVALVNRYPFTREIKVSFVELGMGDGEFYVKDLWRQQCEGKHAGFYVVKVPPHATKLVYVKRADCMKCE